MRAVSLFSGVGGFEIGFDRAGIETVLQAERDPWCQQVLARHWPQTERVSDVADVQARRLQHATLGGGDRDDAESRGSLVPGHVDLVYGGFPCQPFSVAGKRAGAADERDGWPEFRRVVRELRPRWVVAENVPGLLSIDSGRYFGSIIGDLDELGFDVAWAVLDAQHWGIPQRRRRVFIVGGPRGRGAEQVLSLCESCGGNPEAGRAPGQELAYALAASARGTGDGHGNAWNPTYVANPLGSHHGRHDLDHDTYVPMTAGTLQAETYHHGGFPNQTMNSENGHVLPVAQGVRRLTPRECERLQGWPDDHTRWTADGGEIADSHRYRMVGNGVASPVAEWIGRRLVAVDAGGE